MLSDLSVDYYTRLEQPRGPYPSEQALASLARGLRLSLEERDHLFRLGGYATPQRADDRSDHVNPGMMRILDGLDDAAAQVVNAVGETLWQSRLSRALIGDESVRTGLARSPHYRWFTDPAARALRPAAEHDEQSRLIAGHLHAAFTRYGEGSRAGEIVAALRRESGEFAELWDRHPVTGPYCAPTRLLHPVVGELELHCQMLVDPDLSQSLVVYTATPGSESYEKLALLAVIGESEPARV